MRVMLFVPAIIQLIILGYAADMDVKKISMAILDDDRTVSSREFIARFDSTDYFDITHYLNSPKEADLLMDRGTIDTFIYVKKGFGTALKGGGGAEILIVVDGTDSSSASVSIGYINRIINSYTESILLEKIEKLRGISIWQESNIPINISRIKLVERTWYNEELESRNFFVPGIIALLLTLISVMLTSMAIVKEREIGTMEQLIVTPIRPIELIFGKLFPFVIIGYVNVVLITTVGILWFGVPFKGSVIFLFFATAFFLTPILGVGLFISTVSKTQQEAMMSTFLFFFPAMLLSGFVFPIESMPKAIRVLTYFDPLRYMLKILRGIFLKGTGFLEHWPDLLGLFLLGVLTVGLSFTRFRKRLK